MLGVWCTVTAVGSGSGGKVGDGQNSAAGISVSTENVLHDVANRKKWTQAGTVTKRAQSRMNLILLFYSLAGRNRTTDSLRGFIHYTPQFQKAFFSDPRETPDRLFFSFFSSLFFSRLFFFSFFPPTFFLLTKARCGRGRNSTTSHTLLELPHNLYFHLGNVPKSPIQLSSSCAFHQSARARALTHACTCMTEHTHHRESEGKRESETQRGGGVGGVGARATHTHTHTRLL